MKNKVKISAVNTAMVLPNAEKWAARQITISQAFLLGNGTETNLVLDAIRKIKENVSELAD